MCAFRLLLKILPFAMPTQKDAGCDLRTSKALCGFQFGGLFLVYNLLFFRFFENWCFRKIVGTWPRYGLYLAWGPNRPDGGGRGPTWGPIWGHHGPRAMWAQYGSWRQKRGFMGSWGPQVVYILTIFIITHPCNGPPRRGQRLSFWVERRVLIQFGCLLHWILSYSSYST